MKWSREADRSVRRRDDDAGRPATSAIRTSSRACRSTRRAIKRAGPPLKPRASARTPGRDPPPAASPCMASDRTNWTGVTFGLSLAALVALQHYRLPPLLPSILAEYDYGRVLAGGLMSIYALAVL